MGRLRLPKLGSFRLGLGLTLFALLLVLGVVMPWFAPNNPLTWYKVPRNQPVSWSHLLGTTNLGQDIFWLLTWALQNSLLLGLSVAFFSTLIGVFAGLAAGYSGG